MQNELKQILKQQSSLSISIYYLPKGVINY